MSFESVCEYAERRAWQSVADAQYWGLTHAETARYLLRVAEANLRAADRHAALAERGARAAGWTLVLMMIMEGVIVVAVVVAIVASLAAG